MDSALELQMQQQQHVVALNTGMPLALPAAAAPGRAPAGHPHHQLEAHAAAGQQQSGDPVAGAITAAVYDAVGELHLSSAVLVLLVMSCSGSVSPASSGQGQVHSAASDEARTASSGAVCTTASPGKCGAALF